MTINAIMTIERNTQNGSDKNEHANLLQRTAFELGWTQSAFAHVLNQIESIYGEAALERILYNVAITPVYSSVE